MSGGVEGARKGELTLIVGGNDEALTEAKPVLSHLAKSVIHVGEAGAGSICKALHNCAVFCANLATVECLTVGVKAGVDAAMLIDVFQKSGLGRNLDLQVAMPATLFQGKFSPPRFAMKTARKDMGLATELRMRLACRCNWRISASRKWPRRSVGAGEAKTIRSFSHFKKNAPASRCEALDRLRLNCFCTPVNPHLKSNVTATFMTGQKIITGIDHPVIAIRDMAAAHAAYARLGFTIPPRGSHLEWGTGNWCILFPDDYLELRGIIDPQKYTHHLDSFLKMREGLMGVALSTNDAVASHDALVVRKLHPQPVRQLTRNFELPEGAVQPRFALCFQDVAETPGLMAVVICQHLTPELLRRPEWLRHQNGSSQWLQ